MEQLCVAVSGSGRMGREVVAALRADPTMEPVAFVDGLAEVTSLDGLPIFTTASACFAETAPHVVVDFSNAAFTPAVAEAALVAGVRPIIGTTGLSPEFMTWLERETIARETGAVVAANFAIGAVLMMHFARQASRFFENAEIIEMHHDQKVDAPSGTAKVTAELMREARGSDFVYPTTETETLPGTRGGEHGGIAIHSVRLPGFVASQQVVLGGPGQTLTLRHDSTGRDSFMPGVLASIRAVMDTQGLIVGLDRLFGLA